MFNWNYAWVGLAAWVVMIIGGLALSSVCEQHKLRTQAHALSKLLEEQAITDIEWRIRSYNHRQPHHIVLSVIITGLGWRYNFCWPESGSRPAFMPPEVSIVFRKYDLLDGLDDKLLKLLVAQMERDERFSVSKTPRSSGFIRRKPLPPWLYAA